ncbi:MAG: 3'(2'),5'-bisphosphate nucleotidase CysQ [Rhizobiaceae bacterium]|nr:3'(2'),5'-bisphosphate nucleotidase CysQ [Rhizobiaceae bacterium]
MSVDPSILRHTRFGQTLSSLAADAGKAILEVRASARLDVARKADLSPVTAADLAANAIIETGLASLLPDVPMVSEETFDPAASRPSCFWLIDPLDGTKEFISGGDDFTVNIALIDDGVPIFGVVDAPAKGVAYSGGAGIGAWRRAGGETVAIRVAPPRSPLRVVASASHLDPQTRAYIDALGDHVLCQAGSSIKICMLAEGNADLYPRLGPTSEWDTAAADAVLRGAGGGLFQLDGTPVRYGKPDIANPHFVARNADPRGPADQTAEHTAT